MHKIQTKHESDFTIERLNLNRLEHKIFNKNNIHRLEEYLNSTHYNYYNIRDTAVSGKFYYKLSKEEVLEKSKEYIEFKIFESLYEADEYLVLQGEIEISEEFIMTASLSSLINMSNRIAMQEPEVILYEYDLKEKREPSIKGLTAAIDYIVEHELIGVVVEFSIFSQKVGVHKENITIWELRNY